MILLRNLLITLSLIIIVSCQEEYTTNDISPKNQDITVLVNYDGHIQSYSDKKHDIKVYLSSTTETLIIKEISINTMELKLKGATVTFKNIEPGDYFIDATWDYNDDGASANEPRSNRIPVNINGKTKTSLTIDLKDVKDISEKGWVEGYLYYNGNEQENHHLYVTVYGPNYFRSEKQVTLYPINLAELSKYGFLSHNIDRGTYIGIDAYWDKNDNKQYDKGIDPYCLDLTSFFINAGMGLKMDMNLLYE